ncbi:methylisocitrate lyase [Bacillus oleivorans]|uniref:Methylisocitrate lyase n=1 Tax=Bacillus oleivorans TaxID=1448271 RepID=A0A285D8J9_9BACI|nr:isocitrate lyase/PEP mutase family protein [Bacillus oleivorans]SNX75513.1 methylisocitrate lyase [Bacillus oleivorans]
MKLSDLIKDEGIVVVPGCYDPLTAKIVENCGFKATYLGGWAAGAHLTVTEPMTTLTDMVDLARKINVNLNIPLMIDGAAAFGNLAAVTRTVREIELTGVQAIHIEDQVVPKRAHYHKGVIDLISPREMVQKLEKALEVRKSKDFLIIGRTDAGRNKEEPFENAIERANIYASIGVDMVMVFPRNMDEVRMAPEKITAPLVYVASEGLGRPIPTPAELQQLGYKMVIYPLTPILAAFQSVRNVYTTLKQNGKSGFSQEETARLSAEVLEIISIPELIKLEEESYQ